MAAATAQQVSKDRAGFSNSLPPQSLLWFVGKIVNKIAGWNDLARKCWALPA
jgi:hypothetical protein